MHSLIRQPPWVTVIGGEVVSNELEREQFFKSKRTRWMGAFNVDACRNHIELILRDVQVIRDMVKDTIELEPSRRKRQQQRDSTHWLTIRDKARQVYRIFEAKWSKACSCQLSHCASLQLLTADHATTFDTTVGMKFILSFESVPWGTFVAPWSWKEVEIVSQEVMR